MPVKPDPAVIFSFEMEKQYGLPATSTDNSLVLLRSFYVGVPSKCISATHLCGDNRSEVTIPTIMAYKCETSFCRVVKP